jgi:6-pyruvoyltetrahydropterin/6-carboxytetrahydropterin synthase
MFEVAVHDTFAAAHALRGYKGKCENLHGHNYRVQVIVEGDSLDDIGLLVDFGDVKKVLRAAMAYMDHRYLNELPPFDVVNPSAENMAKWFYEQMENGLKPAEGKPPVRIQAVKVWETDTAVATYRK